MGLEMERGGKGNDGGGSRGSGSSWLVREGIEVDARDDV